MEYWVGDTKLSYPVETSTAKGEDFVLLDHADDLTANTAWSSSGFSILPLFDEETFSGFSENVQSLLIRLWKKSGHEFPKTFNPSNYHTIISTWEKHLKSIEYTKLLDVSEFPVPIQILENRISEIIGLPLIVKNPFDNQSVFHFRVIRPNSKDNNPLHRDVWLPDYKDCVNLYIPVAGSNEKSSLIIASGSHHWPESLVEKTIHGAIINGISYNVPAVSKILTDAKFVRPNPRQNEVLIFSPYLIHGGSVNLNLDQTRISIEVRLWRK